MTMGLVASNERYFDGNESIRRRKEKETERGAALCFSCHIHSGRKACGYFDLFSSAFEKAVKYKKEALEIGTYTIQRFRESVLHVG